MWQRHLVFSALLAIGSLAMGCETTGVANQPDAFTETDSGSLVDTGPRGDAGPDPHTLSYMPMGCAYTVSTPHAVDTGMSRDVFGATADPGTTYDATPGHIHTSWAGPTDTTFAVNWHTNTTTFASSLLIGADMATVMAADDAATGVTRHDGHYLLFSSMTSGAGAEMVHEVHVCGLTPSTTYYYRVGGPGHWSAVFDFATGPAIGSSEPFTFGVTGDSRGYEDNAWAITEQRMQQRGVDFALFSGDAVELGPVQSQWDQFFEQQVTGSFTVQDLMARRPLMMANGNHDLLTINYLAQFAFPQQMSTGEIGQGEDWYSFDYGNAHFVFLNDSAAPAVTTGAEATWLEADLMAVNRATTPWIIVVHHKPLYTCAMSHDPEVAMRSVWQPIFDRYHVDFVLAGHNHEYERTVPIFGLDATGGHAAAQGADAVPTITGGIPSGTIYMVAAGAGAPLYPVDASLYATTYTAMSVRNYVTFEVNGRTLHVTVHNALTDAVIDEFMYTK